MSAPKKPHQNSKPYLPSVSIPPSTSMHIRIPTQTPTVTWSLLGRRAIGRRGRRPILVLGRRTIGRSGSGLTLSHGLGGENNVDSIESGSWPCFSSRSPFVAISHVFAESQLFCTAPLLDRFLFHHPAVLTQSRHHYPPPRIRSRNLAALLLAYSHSATVPGAQKEGGMPRDHLTEAGRVHVADFGEDWADGGEHSGYGS